MGQTLTHGVYLPDEGERNCYSGLAGNWQILDTSVGTIAANTAALSGKAPLVHTHTKSDVTDLFNSANTWSANQTFTDINRQFPSAEKGVTPSSNNNRYDYINDKNGVYLGSRQFSYNTAGDLSYSLKLENLYDSNNQLSPNGSTKYVFTSLVVTSDGTPYYKIYGNTIPNNTNRFDLGNSSNQWKSVYAQSYYYNGVAWGLDKANTWTQSQTISINLPAFTLQDTIGVRNTTPANVRNLTFNFLDKNGDSYGFINRQHKAGTGTHLHQVSISNGTYDYRVQFYLYTDGKSDYVPSNDGVINLGTSTNRWKTLNGINPGALSLPDYDRFEPIDFSQFDVNLGWNNLYTPSEDGWLYAEINDTATNSIYIYSAGLQPVQTVNRKYGVSAQGNGSQSGYGGRLAIMIPVRKGIQYRFLIKASAVSDIYAVIFYPCLGNV